MIASAAGLAALAFIVLLAVGLNESRVNTSIDDAITAGRPRAAPGFSLPMLANGSALGRRDGQRLALADLRGRPVVLNFWASWCVPCRREAPRLEATWRDKRGGPVVVLGLNVQDLQQKALAFVRRYGQTYPTVRAAGEGPYRAYGLTGIPETFFIDRKGRVRIHWIGEISQRQLADGVRYIDSGPGRS